MLLKALLVILLAFIILNLFRALPMMLKSGSDSGSKADPKTPRVSRYLGWRIAISVVLFALLLLALASGYITPNPRPY